jgi:hypothetical protein
MHHQPFAQPPQHLLPAPLFGPPPHQHDAMGNVVLQPHQYVCFCRAAPYHAHAPPYNYYRHYPPNMYH